MTQEGQAALVKEFLLRSLPHVSLWLEGEEGQAIAVRAGLLMQGPVTHCPKLAQAVVALGTRVQPSASVCLDRVVSALVCVICGAEGKVDFHSAQRSGLAHLVDSFAQRELGACFQWARRSRVDKLAKLPAHGDDRMFLLKSEASARLCQERFISDATIHLFEDMLGQMGEEKKRRYRFSYVKWDVDEETGRPTESTRETLLRVRDTWKEGEDLAVAVGYPLHFFLLVRESGQWMDCNTLSGLGKEAADAIVGDVQVFDGKEGLPEMAQLGVEQASGTACGVYSCLFLLAFALGMEDLKDVLVPFQDQKGRDDTVAMRRWLFRSCAVGRVDLGPWREKEEK